MKIPATAICLFFFSTILSGVLQAQELSPPEPIDLTGRFSPAFGGESIIKARFTIKADGTVDDLDLDTILLANPFARNTARDIISKWTFKPATVNDKPVDYFNQEYVLAFRADPDAPPVQPGPGGPRNRNNSSSGKKAGDNPESETPAPVFKDHIQLALSPDIKAAFDDISSELSNGDNEKALNEIDKHLRKDVHTVFDFALLQELKTSALIAQKDNFAALEASKLATMNTLDRNNEPMYFLTDDALELSLRKKLILAASVHQSALVMETFEELASKFTIAPDDQARQLMQTAKEVLESPDPLPLLARIEDDAWSFKASRRIFTVSDVDGRLKKINVNCERKNLELDFQQDIDWTLPDILGECQLEFIGKKGTTFVVYQFTE